MSTLLMRLAAPLQSWGRESKFDARRDTGREPGKSGVIGLIAAALGIARNEDAQIQALSQMRFGVRVDREGQLLRDYHTARMQEKAVTCVTNRYYLTDAVFVAAVESNDEEQLQRIANALLNPAYPLYLGRRSCPPTGRIYLGIVPLSLEKSLEEYPRQTDGTGEMRIILDAEAGQGSGLVRDVPVSFNPVMRLHTFRRVIERTTGKEHDPFAELEE